MSEYIEHNLQMSNRAILHLTGISRVLNFDENEIGLMSSMGILTIQGVDLHITMLNLDEGRVSIEGTFHGLAYKNAESAYKQKSKKVMTRLFK